MGKKINTNSLILLLALTISAVIFCYFVVDRQVAILIAQYHLRSYNIFKYLSQLPEIFILASALIFIGMAIKASLHRLAYLNQHLLNFAYGIAITYLLKDFFKVIFGRSWPDDWVNNGFYFFKYGSKTGAFPSGHAAILVAGITLLWSFYPRLKYFYLLFAFLSLVGIVAMNYHFVGDIIAGGVLGYLVAILIVKRNMIPAVFTNI